MRLPSRVDSHKGRLHTTLPANIRLGRSDLTMTNWGAQYLTGDDLKVVWAEFSTLS
jgi:hypothetical protein